MYCIKCGTQNKNSSNVCRKCKTELIHRELTGEEVHELSKSLHNRLSKVRENFDAGMVFVVLGTIFLIIGIMFCLLSFKVPSDPDALGKQLSFTCFEFYVSLAGLSSGSILLIIGIIRVILNKGIREKEITRTLKSVQNGNYKHEL